VEVTSGTGDAGATPPEDGCGCTQGRASPLLALLTIATRRRRRPCGRRCSETS
jgi:hypothetical protein